MKLVSFLRDGVASYGLVEGDEVLDLGGVLRGEFADLKALLAGDALGRAAAAKGEAKAMPLAGLHLLPPIPNPAKIFCIGHNYEEHRNEMNREKLPYPAVFTRFADSQTGHGEPVLLPRVSSQLDFEGEMAVVIGRGGRYIAGEEALAHVAGYSCYLDGSVRDWQRHTSQFTPGKNFPGTGGFGPWMVTTDEIADPQTLELTTRLNGAVVQQANTGQMIFPVRELIAYCSSFTPLSAGDVIVSGTPGGVGVRREPQLFMKAGDVVEVEIGSIGTLRHRVEAAG